MPKTSRGARIFPNPDISHAQGRLGDEGHSPKRLHFAARGAPTWFDVPFCLENSRTNKKCQKDCPEFFFSACIRDRPVICHIRQAADLRLIFSPSCANRALPLTPPSTQSDTTRGSRPLARGPPRRRHRRPTHAPVVRLTSGRCPVTRREGGGGTVAPGNRVREGRGLRPPLSTGPVGPWVGHSRQP